MSSLSESSEIEANNSNDTKVDFSLLELSGVRELEKDEIYGYVEKIHSLYRRQERKLRKYKSKIKRLLEQIQILKSGKVEDANVPKDSDSMPSVASPREKEVVVMTPKETKTNEDENTATNFVEEIRRAAEQAQNLNGFVYEPTSGLYYDHKTGYYYNAEYGLYYDGNTGCYYNYNQDKNEFVFHSQVSAEQIAQAVIQSEPEKYGSRTDSNIDHYENKKANRVTAKSDDDSDGEVCFDETGGVITDAEVLRRLRKKKRKESRKLSKSKRKKTKKDKTSDKKKSKKHKGHKKKRARESDSGEAELSDKNETGDDLEDGELNCSSSSSSDTSSSEDSDSEAELTKRRKKSKKKNRNSVSKGNFRFEDIAKRYPPSLRIIVQETNLESLKVGSLNIITYKGGSLGREGSHDVIIPDVNVSKYHLNFVYDTKKAVYKCVDLGSQNGTILNGKRMSAAKVESEALDLVHGSLLQIGQTKLLCHVHEGNSTCGLCEPGLLIEKEQDSSASKTIQHLTHKEQLKLLQKKYGLQNEKFVDSKSTPSSSGNYKDRAATRRTQIGSSTDKEKTQIASVHTEISSDNKGFKMLSKLGWNKGDALGKTQSAGALKEPVKVTQNEGTKGLGCDLPSINFSNPDKKKIEALRKMKERFQKADIFDVEDCDNDG